MKSRGARLEVVAACVQELGDRIGVVHRHDAAADRVVGRVQAHRERHRERLLQLADVRAPRPRWRASRAGATGRSRGRRASSSSRPTTGSKLLSGSPMPIITTLVTARRASPVAFGSRPRRGSRTVLLRPASPSAADSPPRAGPTISPTRRSRLNPCAPGRAELAVERASDLGRNAQRPAVVLGNEDRLDAVADADIEEPLHACRRRSDAPRRSRAAGSRRPPRASPAAPSRGPSSRRSRTRRAGGSSGTPGARETASRPGRRATR